MKNEFNNITGAGKADAERFDPVSLMFRDRVIMVTGQVGPEMTYHITSQLKKLELLDPRAPITMMINSPGGSVVDGLAILDIMRDIKCPITTIGNGMQASMGSILLAGGDERYMTKNSALLIHQIMGGAAGGTQHSDFEISAAFMAGQHERLKSVYVEFTGLNHKFWDMVGERDTWITAEQAEKLGFINGVTSSLKDGGKYAADAKRADDVNSLQYKLDKVIEEHIANMSAADVAMAINSGSAEGGIYSRHRADLILRLSEFPEYWTDTKKVENGISLEASNVVKLANKKRIGKSGPAAG